MRRNGFTLVELLVVIGMMGTLLAMGALYFHSMMSKGNIEREIKEMYADLMTVRSEALFQKKMRSVTISSNAFSVYSSSNVSVTPLSTRQLQYALNLNPAIPATLQIDFDNRGVATFNGDITIQNAVVCAQETGSASTDSIAFLPTIIQMGRQKSAGCSYGNTAL